MSKSIGEIIATPFNDFQKSSFIWIALFALQCLINLGVASIKIPSQLIVPKIFSLIISALIAGYFITYVRNKFFYGQNFNGKDIELDAICFLKEGTLFLIFQLFTSIFIGLFFIPLGIFWSLLISQIIILIKINPILALIIALPIFAWFVFLIWKFLKYLLVAVAFYLKNGGIFCAFKRKTIDGIINRNSNLIREYAWMYIAIVLLYLVMAIPLSLFSLISKLFAALIIGILAWYFTIMCFELYSHLYLELAAQEESNYQT